jgi:hypothetical protein
VPGAQALCLAGGRFRVEVTWRLANGATGAGRTAFVDGDSGAFWFFGPDNLELAVKALDGRAINGRYWLFYGALSDVEYWVTATDTVNGTVRTYHNPPRTLCGRADNRAFP